MPLFRDINILIYLFLYYYKCNYRQTRNLKGYKMNYTHGSLENEILKTIWMLEELDESDVSVNEVQEILNRESVNKRAYTTVKTVMDRLVEKNMLVRYKQGKKFYYQTISSRDEMAQEAIKKVARQYFNNDMNSFADAVRNMSLMQTECKIHELV